MRHIIDILFILTVSLLLNFCTPATGDTVRDDLYQLAWSDEFEDSTLDSAKWTVVIGDGCPDLCGFGNREKQYYSDSTSYLKIEEGKLVITGAKDSLGSQPYSSAKIMSKGKGDWKHGRIEVRAKLPMGKGTWPAIWMLPTKEGGITWPDDGEIDIMEHVGYNQGMVYGALHTGDYNGMYGTQICDSTYVEDVGEVFHTYALQWESGHIAWSLDGEEYARVERTDTTYSAWPFVRPYHLIINLAVGGNWGGKYGIDDSIWPQQFEIDYVRVYQK